MALIYGLRAAVDLGLGTVSAESARPDILAQARAAARVYKRSARAGKSSPSSTVQCIFVFNADLGASLKRACCWFGSRSDEDSASS